MDELQGHDRLLDEFLCAFDFLQIALKYGYMIQRLVRSIRPKIACAEADIVSWLYLSLHVVSGCVGKRGCVETCTIVPVFRECKRVPERDRTHTRS